MSTHVNKNFPKFQSMGTVSIINSNDPNSSSSCPYLLISAAKLSPLPDISGHPHWISYWLTVRLPCWSVPSQLSSQHAESVQPGLLWATVGGRSQSSLSSPPIPVVVTLLHTLSGACWSQHERMGEKVLWGVCYGQIFFAHNPSSPYSIPAG